MQPRPLLLLFVVWLLVHTLPAALAASIDNSRPDPRRHVSSHINESVATALPTEPLPELLHDLPHMPHMSRGLVKALGSLPQVTLLLALSAVFAGLTVGVMGVDGLSLEIIAEGGKEPDRSCAAAILPVRRKGHEMLCTIIIGNMLTNVVIVQTINAAVMTYYGIKTHSTKPSVTPAPTLDPLLDGSFSEAMELDNSDVMSFIVSTVLIVIFAEILPMSVCKSKNALRIAAAGVPIVVAANMILLPIVKPLGWLLDRLVAHDAGQIYDRNELKRLMVLHCEAHGEESGLVSSELKLLLAAMDFTDKKCVQEVMTPLLGATCATMDEIADEAFLARIWRSGRSRIPVLDSSGDVVEVLFAKDLLTAPNGATVGDLLRGRGRARQVLHVLDTTPLPKMLKMFQQARVHIAFVHRTTDEEVDSPFGTDTTVSVHRSSATPQTLKNTIGLVTLEDVVEEIIREEIYDEYDDDEANEGMFFSPGLPRVASSLQVGNSSQAWLPKPPKRPVRVHFSSFKPNPSPTSAARLTPDQLWAISFFLAESNLSAFKGWKCGHFKALLDELDDTMFFPPSVPPVTPAPRPPATPATRRRNIHQMLLDLGGPQGQYVLYRTGVAATAMTLVLSGRVDVALSEGFTTEMRSFRLLAEDALSSPEYFPDFTAVVVRPTRAIRIERDTYNRIRSTFGLPAPEAQVRAPVFRTVSSVPAITPLMGGSAAAAPEYGTFPGSPPAPS
jgi:metal transporter CNNM